MLIRKIAKAFAKVLLAIPLVCSAATGDFYFSGSTFKSKIGIWFTPWWDLSSTARYENWKAVRYIPNVGTSVYNYNSNDDYVINYQLSMMKSAGIDYLIFDFTNGIWGMMKDAPQRISEKRVVSVSAAIGAGVISTANQTLDQRNATMQSDANYVYDNLVQLGNYYSFQGAPLLVTFNAYDVLGSKANLPAWYDFRFNVQRATGTVDPGNQNLNFVAQGYGWNSWWGWFTQAPFYSPTAMSVAPGIDTTKNYSPGTYQDRQDGNFFMKEWIAAIRQNPSNIVVSSWNDYNEETHIEPSFPITNNDPGILGNKTGKAWLDANGNAAPYLYVRILTAYAALRENRLVNGYFYRDESGIDVYKVADGQLQYIGDMKFVTVGYPVVLLPAGWLNKIRSGTPL